MKHIWLCGTLFALQTPQDSCPCPGVGEATGPVGTATRSTVNGVAASAHWSCSCGFTELLKPGWGPQSQVKVLQPVRAGLTLVQSRGAGGLWVGNTRLPQSVLSKPVCLSFLLLTVCSQKMTLIKCSFAVSMFFS